MDRIEKMKRKNTLELTRRQMLMHFFWGFFIMALVVVLSVMTFVQTDQEQNISYLILILTVIACLYILRQLRSLGFHIIPVKMSDKQFRQMFDAIAVKMDWIMEFNTRDCIIATTEFRWTNWGTLITIVHDKDRILVTSICDLYKRPSTLSWGQNKKNVQAVKQYIAQHFHA
jgi:hypothetical protein